MIYNIAVFGSCASRDNFYSGINPDYKKYFNCSISSQRGSIISLMQEPVPFKNQRKMNEENYSSFIILHPT